MFLGSSVRTAKLMMLAGQIVLIVGGVLFLILAVLSREAILASVVAWGCGSGTAIYASGKHAIATLEKEITAQGLQSETRTE
jgi:hypothetical protein